MKSAYYPEAVELDAYGNGGFRFADMSHKGSLLILPTGIYGWDYSDASLIKEGAFQPVFDVADTVEFMLFGTGTQQVFPSMEIRKAFIEAGIGLEVMDTGAAARTYNVLQAEGRSIAAALIAVE